MAGSTRRDLFRIAVVLGVVGLVTARPWRAGGAAFTFTEVPGLPPLRRLATSDTGPQGSAADAFLIGLERPGMPLSPQARTLTPNEVCAALHLPWAAGTPLPITYFTDILCPVCRRLEADLETLAQSEPGLFTLITREFPVFGPASEAAARLILAATLQGAAERMRRYLQARPSPTHPGGVRAVAEALSLDADVLVDAWSSPQTAARLAEDRMLAQGLALRGTPGLVIGRTIVPGALPRATLKRLINAEIETGPPAPCT